MKNGIHFISGLPRSGSTLLAALLRQNPNLHANITSPVGPLMLGAMGEMSAAHEGSVFLDDARRAAVLRGLFEGYYYDIHPHKTVLDTNRLWCCKLPTIKKLYPDAKIICCVRDVPWIYDSLERLVQRNALEPSKLFGFEPSGTVYDRFEMLNRSNGLVGFAWTGLRQAFYGGDSERLLLVTFETLTTDPARALHAIYGFLGLPSFKHDVNNIDFDVTVFDAYLGTPGLHTVGKAVKAPRRDTILPPELFNRVVGDTFWRNPEFNPRRVKVI
ncbi:MAG: sulfotransferase [Beijerinckiaceae bacterium]|nr:sulfotransferase [Beijerinckiaceae bacterium]